MISRLRAFARRFSTSANTIPGVAFGLTFERIEDWEYGDYGERFGCDFYFDVVAYFFCWRIYTRYWRDT